MFTKEPASTVTQAAVTLRSAVGALKTSHIARQCREIAVRRDEVFAALAARPVKPPDGVAPPTAHAAISHEEAVGRGILIRRPPAPRT